MSQICCLFEIWRSESYLFIWTCYLADAQIQRDQHPCLVTLIGIQIGQQKAAIIGAIMLMILKITKVIMIILVITKILRMIIVNDNIKNIDNSSNNNNNINNKYQIVLPLLEEIMVLEATI